MTKQEKKTFIKSIIKAAQDKIIAAIPTMPEEWEGVELRWLIEDAMTLFADNARFGTDKKRRKSYENECMVKNIL